jgi:capsule polysaccharide export protein KpsE/RkpR
MSDETRKLRIRITPPINNNGEEKLWNRNRWVKKSNAIRSARAKATEDVRLLRELEANLDKLSKEIERLKGRNPNHPGLPILVAELERYEKLLTKADSTATDSITDYYYLRNGTPRRGGKSKKRR